MHPASRLVMLIALGLAFSAGSLGKSGKSQAIVKPLPAVLHECDVNCNTLKLVDGNYVIVTRYPWDRFPGPIVWKVESWNHQSVRLHRTYPVDQVFEGPMSSDGNSLTSVTVNGAPGGTRIAWGAALDTVYGSNSERDRIAPHTAAASGNSPAPAITDEQWQVCGSTIIRGAMQQLEDKVTSDPAAIALQRLACGVTGVCGNAGRPTVFKSRPATDSAGYTKGEPKSFLCQGLFAR